MRGEFAPHPISLIWSTLFSRTSIEIDKVVDPLSLLANLLPHLKNVSHAVGVACNCRCVRLRNEVADLNDIG